MDTEFFLNSVVLSFSSLNLTRLCGEGDALVGAGEPPPRRRDDPLAEGERGGDDGEGQRRVRRLRQRQPPLPPAIHFVVIVFVVLSAHSKLVHSSD